MPKLHDLLCKHLLREALDPLGNVELEKPVAPLDEQRIDVYCEIRDQPPPSGSLEHLGLLRQMAGVAQRFLIEPFSATPSVEAVDDNLRKKFQLHHALKKSVRSAALAKPVLWVLSPGRPEEVMRGYAALPVPGWPSGVYGCVPELTTWIIVLAELPKTQATRLLRLLGPPAMQLQVLRELDEQSLDEAQRKPWIEMLADIRYLLLDEPPELSTEEQIIMTELRQRWEREKAELRAEGLRTGKAEGKAEGILAVLTARGLPVSERVRQQVLSCKDLAVLDRWLARAITAPSATDVIAA